MISLAVKYRPTTFNDVVAQENIKAILEQQIVTKNHKNCYLFTGGAGTGKTTCARIFANELMVVKVKPLKLMPLPIMALKMFVTLLMTLNTNL